MAKERKQIDSEYPFSLCFKVSEKQRDELRDAAYENRIPVAEEIRRRLFESLPKDDFNNKKSKRMMCLNAKKLCDESAKISSFIEGLCDDLHSLRSTPGVEVSDAFWEREIKSVRNSMRRLENLINGFNSQYGDGPQEKSFSSVKKYVWTTVSGPLDDDAKTFDSKRGTPMLSFNMLVSDVVKNETFTAPFTVYASNDAAMEEVLKKGANVCVTGNLHLTFRYTDGKPTVIRTVYAEEVKVL